MTSQTKVWRDEIAEILIKRNQTLGFAESCTGGLLSSCFVEKSGASAYFKGSIVSYSAAVKKDLLSVPFSLIKEEGQVSLSVARQMSMGALKQLDCDWVVSVTGWAGSDSELHHKNDEVGLVCFAVLGPKYAKEKQTTVEGNNRRETQEAACAYAIELLHEALFSNQ